MRICTVLASDLRALNQVRELFREYAESLGEGIVCFESLEKEVAGLPGEYSPPRGRLLLAIREDRAAGCVALRSLAEDRAEMKRLYVRPDFRGAGVGRQLAERVIAEARRIGFSTLQLDTLPTMRAASALYQSLGFREIDPYRPPPAPGTRFFELVL